MSCQCYCDVSFDSRGVPGRCYVCLRTCSSRLCHHMVSAILLLLFALLKCAFSALTLSVCFTYLPPVLSRCWLGGRKGIRPVQNWVVGCWHGYLSGVRCRLAYGPADATATHFSCYSKIQIGFTFLVLVHRGSPGQRAVKLVCVCVCVCLLYLLIFATHFC